jgi:hypothetical protein
MSRFAPAFAVIAFTFGSTAFATDVINQDKKEYKIKVQGEAKLGVSTHTVKSGSSAYGLCNYSFCSFEIPGHRVTATRDAKLFIHGGKFKK